MSELIVFTFENEIGAKELETGLITAQTNQEIKVNDAALVVRREDGRPLLNHAVNLVDRGSLGGIFWGFILALVFWTKWWGLSVGGALGDLGLDEDFVKEVGDNVERGHSALLVMVDDGAVNAVLESAGEYNPKVMRTSFSEEDQQVLKTIFQAPRE
jgi:uncharacterized membrane protein